MDDAIQAAVKNKAWKHSKGKADWVVACDCDELLWSNHLEEELQYMKDNGYTAMGNVWYAFFGESKPEYQEGKLLHELVKRGARQVINWKDKNIGKIMLFNPNVIEDMKYEVGCHVCNPIGDYKLYKSDKVYTFHIDKGFGLEYKIKESRKRAERLSERNKRFKWGFHYKYSEEEFMIRYNQGIENSIDLTTLS